MSEEDVLAGQPAPEPEVTSAPAPEVTETEDKPVKTFTQEELDAAIGKRLAREQRKWEREQQAKLASQAAPKPADPPSPEQFSTPEAYAEALAERKAEELLRQREIERQRLEYASAYEEKEQEAMEKYDDFKQVAHNPILPITQIMAESIQTSDAGPEIAYFLGLNPKEADRISRLPPILQAKEIGKIEARLAANPPVKKTTSAPAPISPVTAKSSGQPAYDTTDPRSIKTMSTSEWIEAERQRQIKKMEAASRYR